jgi:DNA-binding LacI/PurR family transcriptional regulator
MRGRFGDVDLSRLMAECSDEVTDARRSAAELLDHGVTAIVCASDTLALGARAAVDGRAAGAPHVPIIGFDDTPVARALGLSSVAQPVVRAARTSISLLVGRLAEERAPEHVLLRPSAVYRDAEIATPPNPVPIETTQEEEITHP